MLFSGNKKDQMEKEVLLLVLFLSFMALSPYLYMYDAQSPVTEIQYAQF